MYRIAESGTEWEQHCNMPRRTAWMVAGECQCQYEYGKFQVRPQRFPQWMLELMGEVMPHFGLLSPAEWPNSCNLNWYQGGSQAVGWHSDDEDLFRALRQPTTILSLSLGETRSFEVQRKAGRSRGISMKLATKDLVTMQGWMQHFRHRVPREAAAGSRLNLTWRWVVQHVAACPLS